MGKVRKKRGAPLKRTKGASNTQAHEPPPRYSAHGLWNAFWAKLSPVHTEDASALLRYDWATVAFVFLISFIAFYLTSAPTIVTEGDAAEFTAAATVGGIAHPPGYPSFIFFTYLIARVVDPMKLARVLNLLSVLAGSGAAACISGILLTLARRWEGWRDNWGVRVAALCSGLLLAGSLEFWTQSLSAEVYTVSMCLMLTAMWLNLTAFGERRPYLAVFLLAFGYGIHHTIIVLSVPITLEFIFRLKLWRQPKKLAFMALAFALGVSSYLYLPIRSAAQPALDFVNPETWKGFWDLVLMRGMPSVNPEQRTLAVWMIQFKSFFAQWWRQMPFWSYPLFGVGLLVTLLAPLRHIISQARDEREAGEPSRWHDKILRAPWSFHWLAFAIFVACSWGYIYITNFKPNTSFENEVRVFYIPAYAMCAFALGMTLWAGAAVLQAKAAQKTSSIVYAVVAVLFLGGWGFWVAKNWHAQDKSKNVVAYNYGKDLLNTCRGPALLFTPGDNAAQPILYFQQVEKYGMHVAAVHLPLIPFPWYHDMLQRIYPDLRIPRTNASALAFIQANITQRTIYFARMVSPKMIPGYRLEPEGILLRVVPQDQPPQLPPMPLHSYAHLLEYEHFSKDLRERSILAEYREGLMRQAMHIFQMGKPQLALDAMLFADSLPPVDFVGDRHIRAYVKINLANIYLRLGKWAIAQRTLERLLKKQPDFKPAQQALQRLRMFKQKSMGGR